MTKLSEEMKAYGAAHGLPVLRTEEVSLLQHLIRRTRPQRILEIGTCIGYSALLILECLQGEASLTTIELDEERCERAKSFLGRSPYIEKITLLQGDATEIIKDLSGPWDFVFLDGPKGQYGRQLKLLMPHLAARAVIAADNVRYHDMMYMDGELPHKHRTAVRRLREFLELVGNKALFETVVFENGDGMTVSRRKD